MLIPGLMKHTNVTDVQGFGGNAPRVFNIGTGRRSGEHFTSLCFTLGKRASVKGQIESWMDP
jgi:hypothetical protein